MIKPYSAENQFLLDQNLKNKLNWMNDDYSVNSDLGVFNDVAVRVTVEFAEYIDICSALTNMSI